MALLGRASYLYVGIVVPASIIIPLFPAIVRYRLFPPWFKVLSGYLFYAALFGLLTTILGSLKVNNLPLMHIFTLSECLFLMFFYERLEVKTRQKRIIQWLALAFIFICILNVLYFQDIYTYNTYTKSIEALLIILLAIRYFIKSLDRIAIDQTRSKAIAYANSGILLYFSGSFIFFLVVNQILDQFVFYRVVMCLHATLLLTMYLLIAVALWKYKK